VAPLQVYPTVPLQRNRTPVPERLTGRKISNLLPVEGNENEKAALWLNPKSGLIASSRCFGLTCFQSSLSGSVYLTLWKSTRVICNVLPENWQPVANSTLYYL
jgi:hypothetical protein